MTRDGPLRINQLALVESVYLFGQLARELYDPGARPDVAQFHLAMMNMTVNDVPAALSPGPVNSMDFGSDLYHATESSVAVSYEWRGAEIKAGEIAFELVSQVYAQFGLTEDQIPYRDASGARWIDPNEITQLHP
jgi:hypothetical protein